MDTFWFCPAIPRESSANQHSKISKENVIIRVNYVRINMTAPDT